MIPRVSTGPHSTHSCARAGVYLEELELVHEGQVVVEDVGGHEHQAVHQIPAILRRWGPTGMNAFSAAEQWAMP